MTEEDQPTSLAEAINQRVSVRQYTTQKLDEETIRDLLAAAVRAPTGLHGESWRFVVVENRELLKRLSDQAKPYFLEEIRQLHLKNEKQVIDEFARPEYNLFYNAGTLIIICGPTTNPLATADCWLAAENLMLAASASGLGSCIIGSAVTGLNQPDTKTELGIPEELSVIVPIIVGVPDGQIQPTPRQAPVVLAWR